MGNFIGVVDKGWLRIGVVMWCDEWVSCGEWGVYVFQGVVGIGM